MVTNYIKNATYKEIYDIHTDTESSSILTFHSPVNQFPRRMLKGFFDQYRRFKYRGATVTLRPVAKLPADPEQISYEAGEPGLDPRDMVNPILVRGYCGDSLGTFLNRYMVPGAQGYGYQATAGGTIDSAVGDGFFGNSVDRTSWPHVSGAYDPRNAYLEKLYYQSLGDPHFQKIGAQRGMKRFFYPLVYELATTTQYLAHNPQTAVNNPSTTSLTTQAGLVNGMSGSNTVNISNLIENDLANNDFSISSGASRPSSSDVGSTNRFDVNAKLPLQATTRRAGGYTSNSTVAVRRSSPILTSHKRRLGWLDTDSVVVDSSVTNGASMTTAEIGVAAFPDITTAFDSIETVDTTLPLINMGIAILPKAYKHEMYWRLSIVHHFDFKDYRPMCGLVSPFDNATMGLTPILEWNDWDGYGEQIYANSSVTSTSKNVELVDIEGLNPLDMGDNFDEPVTA